MVVKIMSVLSYCGQQVKRYDPDRYLLAAFYSSPLREALWALFAFNLEIAKTREVVSETQIGLIRLQWWREAIEEIYQDKPIRQHQVLDELAQIVRKYKLPYALFDTLISARELDLNDMPFLTYNDFYYYNNDTSSTLTRLVYYITGESLEDTELEKISVFYSTIGLIRALPFHLQQRQCYIPKNLIDEAGARVSRLFDFKETDKTAQIIRELINKVRIVERPQSFFLRKLYALSNIYKKQIEGLHYDVFGVGIQIPPKFLHVRVLFS